MKTFQFLVRQWETSPISPSFLTMIKHLFQFLKYISSILTRFFFIRTRTGNPDKYFYFLRSLRILPNTELTIKVAPFCHRHCTCMSKTRVSLSMLNQVHVLSSFQKSDKWRSPFCTVSSLAYYTDLYVVSIFFIINVLLLSYCIFFKNVFVLILLLFVMQSFVFIFRKKEINK